jgi:hypothetical protein
MICPRCRAEYRRGFTECADCGVALVEPAELLEGSAVNRENAAAPGDPTEDPFCSFWKGTDLRVCTEICTVLDEAGIPHKTIRRQDHLFNFSNQAPYEVGVPASLYEKAELAIKEAFGTDAEGAEDAVYESEEAKLLPEQTNHVVDAGILSPLMNVAKSKGRELLREIRNGNDYDEVADEASADLQKAEEVSAPRRMKDLEKIYPEDATAKVWDGEDQSMKEMLAMSLRENDVFAREDERSGRHEIFVMPEDEGRAKEIVLEILEGQAPE